MGLGRARWSKKRWVHNPDMQEFDLVYRDMTRQRPSVVPRALVVRTFRAARPFLKLPRAKTAELSVTLLGPSRMREMNRKHRRVDTPTDVLSFPLRTPEIAGYTAIALGDLFVCPAVIRAKADAAGVPVRRQAAWTLVHGLLHLAGYDHERGARHAARMATLEQRILTTLG